MLFPKAPTLRYEPLFCKIIKCLAHDALNFIIESTDF